jgi:hypothetical protein
LITINIFTTNLVLLHQTPYGTSHNVSTALDFRNCCITGKPGRPSSKPVRPTKKPYVPLKPFDTNKDDDGDFDEGKDDTGPQYAVGFNVQNNKPGTTIIRNIGRDYFGVPPGVSVRAHVQSIDLYPFESKLLSPSEAIEKDKT